MKIIKEIEKSRLNEKEMNMIAGGGLGECPIWQSTTQCVKTFNTCSQFLYLKDGQVKLCPARYQFNCDGYCNPL